MADSLDVISPASVRRLLIVKPSSLGDIVHALPTFALLRARYPDAEISWLVKSVWASVLERVPGLDRIWRVGPNLSAWLSTMAQLRQVGFDLVVDLQGLFRSGAATWMTGCPIRVGLANAREGSHLCYTHRVPVPSPDIHAVDRYLLVAQALGCPASPVAFPLRATDADRDRVETALVQAGFDRTRPCVAMLTSARWVTKRWPLASFVTVAQRLREDGVQTIVIGSEADRVDGRTMAGQAGAIDMTGRTSLAELPALLGRVSCVVTNDSGPMHIAAAVGTPVVALFGPTSPQRTGPYGTGHHVLGVSLECRPCYSRTCRHGVPLECLTAISPEHVMGAVSHTLAGQRRMVVS
ncbi:MAG: lipopolysaccharide heptosyltransferase II [Nitrospiraceae bacterium]